MAMAPERALALAIVRLAKQAETPDELLTLASAYEKLHPLPDSAIHLGGDAQMLDGSASFFADESRAGFRPHRSHARVVFVRRENDT